MATSMQERIAVTQQEPLNSENIASALRPWRRRITIQQTLRWLVGGTFAGLLLASIVLIISRLTPWASAPYWAIGLGVSCLLIASALAFWYRPSTNRITHLVDSHLALHDRMGTAWELREEKSVLARLQRRDALKQLKNYVPATAISLRPRRSTWLSLPVLALVLALLIILPNPMTDILRQQATFNAHIAQQIKAIQQIRKNTTQQANIPKDEKQQIDQILHDLQAKLAGTKNETEAQQAIAEAQAKLDQLRNPQTASQTQAQAAAAAALQNSANANLKATGQALANGDSKKLAQSLQNLASQVSNMSNDQRSQLAQQVEKAANDASQNPALSSALHQLAKAIADGNASEISDATKAVEAAQAQGANAQAQDNAINQAEQNLQNSANSIAASTDNSGNTAQSQGQNQGQQGQKQGQGQQGQGQNQGQQGQSQGQGQGQGQNQGQGQGQGQNQGQGQGGSGGSNGSGNQNGKDEPVYVQGQIGQGSTTQSTDNNSGVVQPGSQVSYSQVIEQYNQLAHDAIDNSSIAPDLKDLVHDYFNTLEGQK